MTDKMPLPPPNVLRVATTLEQITNHVPDRKDRLEEIVTIVAGACAYLSVKHKVGTAGKKFLKIVRDAQNDLGLYPEWDDLISLFSFKHGEGHRQMISSKAEDEKMGMICQICRKETQLDATDFEKMKDWTCCGNTMELEHARSMVANYIGRRVSSMLGDMINKHPWLMNNNVRTETGTNILHEVLPDGRTRQMDEDDISGDMKDIFKDE